MDHRFSLKAWIGIVYLRIVTLDQRKCYNLDPRSLVKGQCHYTHSGFWHCLCHNFSLSSWTGIIFYRIVTLDPRKCHYLDSRLLVKGQGHSITLWENLIDRIKTKWQAWRFCKLTQWFFMMGEKFLFFV
jgi:hypothetical protein